MRAVKRYNNLKKNSKNAFARLRILGDSTRSISSSVNRLSDTLRASLPLVGLCGSVFAANMIVPTMIANIWVRDGDTWNWFCGGILLTELSLLGMLIRLNYGRMELRVLVGVAISIGLMSSAWIAFAWTGRIGVDDAKAFLSILYGILAVFTAADLIFLHFRKLTLESISQDGPHASLEVRFSLTTILSLTALAALMAFQWRYGLNRIETAYRIDAGYRDIRSYYSFPPGYLMLMASYLWVLHISILTAILKPKSLVSLAICILLCTFGLEGMRRAQEFWTVWKLEYLNWEFPLIVFALVVAHIIVGYTVRCLGWELGRSSTIKYPEANLPKA